MLVKGLLLPFKDMFRRLVSVSLAHLYRPGGKEQRSFIFSYYIFLFQTT